MADSPIVDGAAKKLAKAPRWAIPAAVGAAAGLFALSRRKTATPDAPVAAVAAPAARGSSGSDYGDISGLLGSQAQAQQARDAALAETIKNSQPDIQGLFGGVYDVLNAQQAAQVQQNAADAAARKADADANRSLFGSIVAAIGDLAKGIGTTSPITGPAVPANPSGRGPSVGLPSSNPGTTAAPNVAPAGIGSGDWAALASWLRGKRWGDGYGSIYAGFPITVRWSGETLPPSGSFPTVNTPVAYNSNHDYWKTSGENAFARTLRWTADVMAANPGKNPTVVWDHQLGRLMRDIGPYNSHQDEWFGTGFDLGSVKDSPFLDANGTPNPAWVDPR